MLILVWNARIAKCGIRTGSTFRFLAVNRCLVHGGILYSKQREMIRHFVFSSPRQWGGILKQNMFFVRSEISRF